MHQIQIIKKYKVTANKRRGQNFLVDENIQSKIVSSVAPNKDTCVLEIGPGLGALTEGLLKSGAEVYAVEKDRYMAEILGKELAAYPRLTLIQDDFLKVDLKQLLPKARAKWKVIGNLPYYVTSRLLLHLLDAHECIDEAVVMMQKEVAARLLARPATKDYGRLTLAVGFCADVSRLFDVSRQCFTPKPDVESTVVRIKFHAKRVQGLDKDLLFKIIAAAFATRRKTILNSLQHSPLNIEKARWLELLDRLAIAGSKRAEELSLKDYMDLTLALQRS